MSLAQDSMVALRAESGPELVPIDRITCGPSVRGGGLSETHVEVLTELNGAWPPIAVWGDQNLVVDGAHRLAAARRLNLRQLAVVHVGGTSDDAFVESVRRNIEHGLPLSLPDRRRAARQLLQFHPNWSDRRIGETCGLSDKTISSLRRAARKPGEVVGLERRVGRDGKTRLVGTPDARADIERALRENPNASLRSIASSVGASPGTVRRVRERSSLPTGTISGLRPLQDGLPDSDPSLGRTEEGTTDKESVVTDGTDRPGERSDWSADPALLTCDDGGEFARWFSRNEIRDDWQKHLRSVPTGRVYAVADEARRRAAAWTSFASLLERRIR